MKKLLLKSMLLLCALIVGSGTMWAQSDKSAVHSSNVSLSGGTNCTVVISSSNYSGKKLGSNGSGGSCTFSAPSGTKYIHIHVAAWKAKSPTLTVKNGSTTIASNISLTSDESISGNSTTYSLSSQDKVTTDYYKVVTLSTPLTQAATITIQSVSERCAVWGVNTEEASTGETTTVTIDDSGITNTDIASGTAAGSLSAVVKNSSSAAIDGATVTWSSSKTSVATINPTTGAVTLVKKGSTTITASYAGVDGTYQPSSKTYVLNVTNSAANDGTSSHPFTVTEARDALDASEIDSETDYYVRGIIAKIGTFDDGNGQLTYWISDDGSMTNNVQCYKGKNVDGAAFGAATDLEVGDFATVKGKLTIYSGTTYEFTENNEVASITSRTKVNIANFTATTTNLILGETETTTTSVTNDQAGWTPVSYTYTSDDESVATVNVSGVVTAVAKGTANITVTPNVYATDATYKVGASKSIEITVSNPSHTATFSVNGVTSNISVEEGDAISFPADPADLGGKKFVGWAEATIDGTTEIAPTFVESATMSTGNVTYYAVFASSSTATVTKTDDITLSMTGVSGNSYSAWSNKQASGGSNAIYAGCNAGGHDAIQLNASTSSSKRGIISTTTGGKLKKITVTWNSNSNNSRSLVVYGSTSAYESVSSFNTSKGTELGSIFKSSGTELTITGNYTYVGLYATEAIYMDEISIEWETTGTVYSGYCTSIPSSVSVNITSPSGFATLYTDYALDFSSLSSELKAYTATVSENTVTLTEVDDIPANTGVVLKGDVKTHNIPVAASSSTAKGDLIGNTSAATAYNAYDGYDLYMLALNGEGKAQFTKVTGGSIAAGKAFLKLSSGADARELNVVFADDDVTGVNTVNVERGTLNGDFYNLAGQRVAQPTKGLYIVNGKKVIVK